jgi:hypothetical protein
LSADAVDLALDDFSLKRGWWHYVVLIQSLSILREWH